MSPATSAPTAPAGDQLPKVQYAFSVDGQADAAWRVLRFTLQEGLSSLYECRVDLAIEDLDADVESLLGDGCVLTLKREPLERRLCGIVERVTVHGVGGGHLQVSLIVRPALFALAQRTNCRIFQNQAAPDILKEMLEKGLEPFGRKVRLELERTYSVREYCVQYDESDLGFVQRLLEEEGITFYFDHAGDSEELVLVDDSQAFGDLETLDGGPVPVAGPEQSTLGVESVREFDWAGELRPTSVVVKDYDWTRPKLQLVREDRAKDARDRDRELFQYGGAMTVGKYDTGQFAYSEDDGAMQAKLTRQAHKGRELCARGASLVTGFRPGTVFELSGHGIAKLDQRYVVTSVSHSGEAPEELLDAPTSLRSEQRYLNRFECMPIDMPYRPERTFPRRRMRGPQTAIVVGPGGEEIFTDEHGRIKVQFHWDRLGGNDDHSSCFVRVVQASAGAGFGTVFIPRIGMEVLVDFIDGSPDHPIVVGCVYNGVNAVPYKLPDEKTKTVLRTNSSPGGDGYNELSFEDAAGSEQVYLQAQKDLQILVKNDKTQDVNGNETLTVTKNRSRTVKEDQSLTVTGKDDNSIGKNQSLSVGGDRATSIGGNRTTSVSGNSTESVGGDSAMDVAGSLSQSVGGDKSVMVAAASTELVAKAKSMTVGLAMTFQVGAKYDLLVGGDASQSVGGGLKMSAIGNWEGNTAKKLALSSGEDHSLTVGGKMTHQVKNEYELKAKKFILSAEEEVSITVGSASIVIKDGNITLKGGKIHLKADSDLTLKGSKISQN